MFTPRINRFGRWRCTALSAFLVLLSACSTVPTLTSDVESRALIDVPFVAQQDFYCGPAALSSIAAYRGIASSQEDIARQSFIPGRKGSLTIEVQAAARRQGLLPYPLAGGINALLDELAAGNPVMVLQNLGLSWWPKWHYAVATGYDLTEQVIYLHSGSRARYSTTLGNFLATWQRADSWAIVPVDAETRPASAEPLAYIQAAHAFEETGHRERAMAYYTAAVEAWPDSALAHMALANAAYNSGNVTLAVEAFAAALALKPSASLWNNYAYALQAAGCHDAAVAAISRAQALSADRAFAESAAEIIALSVEAGSGPAPASCP